MVVIKSSRLSNLRYRDEEQAFSGTVNVAYIDSGSGTWHRATRVQVTVKSEANAPFNWVEQALIAEAVRDVSLGAQDAQLSLVAAS